jgi:hypothetical protein
LLASLVPQLSAFPAAYTIHPHLGHVWIVGFLEHKNRKIAWLEWHV